MPSRTIRTDHGRVLGLTALGDPVADRLVLLFPPTPGAGGFDPDPLVTGRWGVHVVTLDRPGYGASPALPDGTEPSVAGFVDDVAGFVRRVERVAEGITRATYDRVGAIGWGEGGVYAAVLAARHPDLVDRLALVGTPRPSVPGPYRTRPIAREGLRVADDDPQLGLPGVGDRLDQMLEHAAAQGSAGVDFDAAAIPAAMWADEVPRVRAETLLLYGEEDPLAGPADGRWLERRIPGARLRTVPGTGMLAIVRCWEDVLAQVAPEHGRVAPHLRDSGALQIERDPRAWSGEGAGSGGHAQREG